MGRWKWPLVVASLLVMLVIVTGWLDINFIHRTRLLTPIPSNLMPMIWGMRLGGVVLGFAPLVIVLRLGGGNLFLRNGLIAFGALPITVFVMNSFAWHIADAVLFHGVGTTTTQTECPVLDFGGRRSHYAFVDCDGSGRVSVEILDAYYEALTAVRSRRAEGADLGVCLQLAVQAARRNKRLILPSLYDAQPPRLSNCKPGQTPSRP